MTYETKILEAFRAMDEKEELQNKVDDAIKALTENLLPFTLRSQKVKASESQKPSEAKTYISETQQTAPSMIGGYELGAEIEESIKAAMLKSNAPACIIVTTKEGVRLLVRGFDTLEEQLQWVESIADKNDDGSLDIVLYKKEDIGEVNNKTPDIEVPVKPVKQKNHQNNRNLKEAFEEARRLKNKN